MGACFGRAVQSAPNPNSPLPVRSTAQSKSGKTQPLKEDVCMWRSEVPITMGQLHSKRDEFWDTAPVFEGRKEIWDAIRAAVTALESRDLSLAQAILDGANIYIPHGTLSESYDELGNEYKVPVYCLSRPLNILEEDGGEGEREETEACPPGEPPGERRVLKLRLSSGADVELGVRASESIRLCKARLGETRRGRQRWFYGGRLLQDRLSIADIPIPDGHLIQVVFND